VVTSPMHTRRACATFAKAGFQVTCVAAFEHDTPASRPHSPGERLAAWRAYLHERLGMVKYGWQGWV